MKGRAVVYRAHDAAGDLLYVGVTENLAQRVKGHRSERPWWRAEVALVEHDPPMPRRRALAAEREQITRLHPRYNERAHFNDGAVVYTLRVDREHLDRLAEIAAGEHRTLVQKLRVMIEAEIARHGEATEPKAAA